MSLGLSAASVLVPHPNAVMPSKAAARDFRDVMKVCLPLGLVICRTDRASVRYWG
jgi:hypothetical protein